MFGAPAEMPDHAAVPSPLRATPMSSPKLLHRGQPKDMGFGHTRLGIHSGDALVGNIGASRRMSTLHWVTW